MNAEQKLAEVAAIFETRTYDEDGSEISDHAYYNLMGAIIDIEQTGKCDEVCLRTLKRVEKQLGRMARLLP